MMHNPTVHVPPWSPFDDGMGGMDAYSYLPSNESYADSDESDSAVDAYSCDEFRMYEFKVRRCARGRSHDWTECPYAHPGEKARRRDPRKYHYAGTACPDFRKGCCKRGDACEFAHGVFECWLHPARYRTQPCKDGSSCRRRVCFFAHTPEQLRVLPESYDGSPLRQFMKTASSPTSTLMPSSLMSPPLSPPSESPPVSPGVVRRGASSVNEVLASLRQLQLGRVKSVPSSWGLGLGSGGYGSPRGVCGNGFLSLPTTPTGGTFGFSNRELGFVEEEEKVERVESGRALREKMFERLSRESSMVERSEPVPAMSTPDVAWVSELVK
ncbi:zinc finger CCCH domain-containing protein 35-like [Typha latifolia]|uniref:zinc finger CCCH domain-containing protein 35-like n=1 Tax=Typha latifolia TaxID=4733 RepID=UPI003C2FFBED